MSIAEKLQTIADNEQRVYEAGKKSEYARFWDSAQVNGNRTIFLYLFAGGAWTPTTLKPKRKMTPTNASSMFYLCGYGNEASLIDFRTIADKFDFSKATYATNIFYSASIDYITADLSSANSINYAFSGGYISRITTLTLKLTSATTSASGAFEYLSTLTNLTFMDGSEIACSLNFSACTKLTHDSLMSIINHLKDGVSGLTLTLGATNLAKLTDAEKAIATQKGWTLL
jgi:hypothetical protein